MFDHEDLKFKHPMIISENGSCSFGGFPGYVPRNRIDFDKTFIKRMSSEDLLLNFKVSWKTLNEIIPSGCAKRWNDIDDKTLTNALLSCAQPILGRGRWLMTSEIRKTINEAQLPVVINGPPHHVLITLARAISRGIATKETERTDSSRYVYDIIIEGEYRLLRHSQVCEALRTVFPDYAVISKSTERSANDSDYVKGFTVYTTTLTKPEYPSNRTRMAAEQLDRMDYEKAIREILSDYDKEPEPMLRAIESAKKKI